LAGLVYGGTIFLNSPLADPEQIWASVPAEARAEILARELVELPQPVEAEPWPGARPCTSDMLPVIGRLLADMVCGAAALVDPAPVRRDGARYRSLTTKWCSDLTRSTPRPTPVRQI
jgi:hypothetical protein